MVYPLAGMPWTIWRYTLIELLRSVLLATAILVSVIAFAAAIKPLAEGALDPLGAVRFMLLAVPPMLAYALPFSAGFGAALVYHRMAQDNETIAAHSGGISHRSLLIPAAIVALLLGGSLSALNEQVIPRFLHAMERMITLDVAQMMIRQIERGQAAELGDVMIHAERIDEIEPPEGSTARQMFLMHRVAAVELGDDRTVESDVTVNRAWLAIGSDPDDPEKAACRILLEDGVGAPASGGLRKIETLRLRTLRIPDAFEEDPKYYTFEGLRELKEHPDDIGFIDVRRMRLAERIAEARVERTLQRELASGGRLTLIGDGDRRYEITADRLVYGSGGAWRLVREGDPVRVRRYEPDGRGTLVPSTDYAQQAWLRLQASGAPEGDPLFETGGAAGPAMRFALQLVDVHTERAGGGVAERTQRDFRGLRLVRDPLAELAGKTSAELLNEAGDLVASDNSTAKIDAAASELSEKIAKLIREIISKQQERMAMSFAAATMLMLGAVTAMRLRDSLPLVVYLRSFFPALAMILLISSGQNYTHGSSVPGGLAVMWSGVVGGIIITFIEFTRLARH
jgi:lipopolysaccharide export LptBFGC system permease protein LptF